MLNVVMCKYEQENLRPLTLLEHIWKFCYAYNYMWTMGSFYI
jgi:hypothetical protein